MHPVLFSPSYYLLAPSYYVLMQTNWSIFRELLRLAWPLMLSNLFFSIQIVIDRTFLSRFDPDASAAARDEQEWVHPRMLGARSLG